jgi:hypothetical protein
MRNSYPGICFVCNTPVAIGEGHFTNRGARKLGRKWRVKHWWHGEKVAHTTRAMKAKAQHEEKWGIAEITK